MFRVLFDFTELILCACLCYVSLMGVRIRKGYRFEVVNHGSGFNWFWCSMSRGQLVWGLLGILERLGRLADQWTPSLGPLFSSVFILFIALFYLLCFIYYVFISCICLSFIDLVRLSDKYLHTASTWLDWYLYIEMTWLGL